MLGIKLLSALAFSSAFHNAGTIVRSSLFYLSVLEDHIQSKNGTSVIIEDGIIRRTANATHNSTLYIPNDEIGGGGVNEKKRNYDSSSCPEQGYNPTSHRSHLLHAIEGLSRYPNYLSRWKSNDVDALEQELQGVLRKVQKQKHDTEEQRRFIHVALREFFVKHPEWKEFATPPKSWNEIREILDPRAIEAIFRSQNAVRITEQTNIDDVISGKRQIKFDTGRLVEWIDEEMFDVYSFPILSKTFCHKLCAYTSSVMPYIETWSQKRNHSPLNSCYRDIDNLGLQWLNDIVFHMISRPLSSLLYGDTELEGGNLDWRQGFIAAYSKSPTTAKPRQRLVPHTDDAEVSTSQSLKQFKIRHLLTKSFTHMLYFVVTLCYIVAIR